MKRYSFFHPPVLSFFSKDLYHDVAANWRGTGFFYLLCLVSLCWIPITIKTAVKLSKDLSGDLPRFIDQVPDITIINGEASISEPMPYRITNTSGDEAILDTTGQTTSLEGKTRLLLTKTQLIFKKNDSETRIYSLAKIENFTLTKERLHAWIDIAKKFFPIVMFPVCATVSFLYRMVQALIYAAIGLLFVSLLKARLDYLSLLRLSTVAVTPVLILDTLLDITGKRIPAWGMICLVVALSYLFFGVRASVIINQPQPTPALEK